MKIIIILSTIVMLAISSTSLLFAQEYKHPGNNSVVIFAPGYDAPGARQDEICKNALDYFANAEHFHVQPSPLTCYKNETASVPLVKDQLFNNAGTIIMHTHGMMWDSTTGEGPYPGFRTGTVAMDIWDNVFPGSFPGFVNNGDYIQDLLLFRLAVSNKPNNAGIYHYVVLPSFIDYYVSNDMPDTFMYLGFCHSMQNDAMWTAFERKGAKVFFGWDEEMGRSDNEYFFNELMQRMLPSDESIDPLTAAAAFADIDDEDKESETEDGEPSFAVMETASPEWDQFVFLDIPLKFYIRPTIDGNPLIKGGQRFSFVYTNMSGIPVETPIKSVRGFAGGGDPALYHYAGPFDLSTWDRTSPVTLKLYLSRDTQAATPLPWGSINDYEVDPEWRKYSFSPYTLAKYSEKFQETPLFLTQREDFILDTNSFKHVRYLKKMWDDYSKKYEDQPPWGSGSILVTKISHKFSNTIGSENIEINKSAPNYFRERSVSGKYQYVNFLRKIYSPEELLENIEDGDLIYNYDASEFENVPKIYSPNIEFNILVNKVKIPDATAFGKYVTGVKVAYPSEAPNEEACSLVNYSDGGPIKNYSETGPTYQKKYTLSIFDNGMRFEEMIGIAGYFGGVGAIPATTYSLITDQNYRIKDKELYASGFPVYAKNLNYAFHIADCGTDITKHTACHCDPGGMITVFAHNTMFKFNNEPMVISVDKLFNSNVWKLIVDENRSSYIFPEDEFSGIMTRGDESSTYADGFRFYESDGCSFTGIQYFLPVPPDSPLEFIYSLEKMPPELF